MRNLPPTSPQGQPDHSLLLQAMPGNHLVLLPNEPTFTIAAVSDQYLQTIHRQRERLICHGFFEVFFSDGRHQALVPQLRYSFSQVIQTKQAHGLTDLYYELHNVQTQRQAGTTWRVVNKPVLDAQGELVYIIHTVEDITQEVQLVEVTQANRYLQDIINLFKEPMQVLEPIFKNGQIVDFRFSFTNQAYAAYASTTPQQLQGKAVSEVFPGYLETVSFTNPVETYKTGQALTFEIHYDKDGLDLYNVMSTAKLGEQVVIHFTDFTHLRQLQAQLESKVEALNRSNERLQQFAYIASHDLQEPLRKIQQFGDLLQLNYTSALGEGSAYVVRMQMAASRMSRLIQDLLSYSRISIGREQSALVSLDKVVQEVLVNLDHLIAETGAITQVSFLPTVRGDASQLSQLFQNLVANALKFRRTGVAPVVRVEAHSIETTALPSLVKPAQAVGRYYRIDVIDNGIGFDEKHVDRIFEVFQRLHTQTEFSGTGIGLAICEKIVANHGGAIRATSQPGQGATFSVYLPKSLIVAGQEG